MKSFIKVLILLFFFIILISCNDKSTETITEQLKDPRDMTWTVDTIYYPGAFQTLMDYLCVLNTRDIYVQGFSSSGPFGSLYHFDGVRWEDQKFGDLAIGILNNITKIEDEVWGCGYTNDYSFIARNDGKIWQRINIDNSVNMITKGYLTSITGDTKTNIWAVGAIGLVLHYNTNRWVKDTIKIPHDPRLAYELHSVVMYEHKPFIMGLMLNGAAGITKVYNITGNEKNWTILDSMSILAGQNNVWKFGQGQLHVGKSGKLYSIGPNIWEYQNGQWLLRYDAADYIQNMYELREDYIFAVGHFSHLAFYDGKSWNRLNEVEKKIPGVVYKDIWTDGKEVFIVGNLPNQTPMKSIVWHGK